MSHQHINHQSSRGRGRTSEQQQTAPQGMSRGRGRMSEQQQTALQGLSRGRTTVGYQQLRAAPGTTAPQGMSQGRTTVGYQQLRADPGTTAPQGMSRGHTTVSHQQLRADPGTSQQGQSNRKRQAEETLAGCTPKYVKLSQPQRNLLQRFQVYIYTCIYYRSLTANHLLYTYQK